MPFKESDFKKYTHFNITSVVKGVVHLEINRPKVLNSFSEETWRQYGAAVKHLNRLEDVRAIVLSGIGKHFCSGIDIKASASMFQSMDTKSLQETSTHLKEFQENIKAGVDCSIPVIAVIHGVSYGLALDLLSATSIRIASGDARLSIKEIDIGIMADIGSLQRMPYLVNNMSKLNELTLTGREFKAKEAKDLGFVSEVFQSKDEALKHATKIGQSIATKYKPAVEGTKSNLEYMTIGSPLVDDGLVKVAKDNISLMVDPGFKEFFTQSTKKLRGKL